MRPVAFFLLFFAAFQMSACFMSFKTPKAKTSPRRIKSGLSVAPYAAVLEAKEVPGNLSAARRLASVRVKDNGRVGDCEYPENVERARDKAMRAGGNVLVITRHLLPSQTGSSCSRIWGEIFWFESLEGIEPRIRWHTARPLMNGDLPLRQNSGASTLPPVYCELKYRLIGDFFNEITVRTYAHFYRDSTWRPSDAASGALLLRRAQLHFNMAELATRDFKIKIAALAPNLRDMTGQAKGMMAQQQTTFRQRAATFDAAWQNAGRSEAILREWEGQVATELAATADWMPDATMSLRKMDYLKID